MPVRRRLLLLAFSLLVPAVIACGIAVLLTYTYERERSEENLLHTTQALAQSLDQEINLIGAFPAAVEMARAMVNMRLRQSPRAYPTDALKAKPAFR